MPFITITYSPKYPLTESEKKWLDARAAANRIAECYSCLLCEWREKQGIACLFRECQRFNENYRDAAEFEARVAVYLAKAPCLTCPDNPQGGCSTRKLNSYGRAHVEACRLKHARLAVEEEMEKEGK